MKQHVKQSESLEEIHTVILCVAVRMVPDYLLWGLPCPNLGTGSNNHHGKMEYTYIQAMDQCVELLIRIAEKYSKLFSDIKLDKHKNTL